MSYNPADFYLKILSNTSEKEENQYRSFFQQPIEILRKSNNYRPPDVTFAQKFNPDDYKMYVSKNVLFLDLCNKQRTPNNCIIFLFQLFKDEVHFGSDRLGC